MSSCNGFFWPWYFHFSRSSFLTCSSQFSPLPLSMIPPNCRLLRFSWISFFRTFSVSACNVCLCLSYSQIQYQYFLFIYGTPSITFHGGLFNELHRFCYLLQRFLCVSELSGKPIYFFTNRVELFAENLTNIAQVGDRLGSDCFRHFIIAPSASTFFFMFGRHVCKFSVSSATLPRCYRFFHMIWDENSSLQIC